MNKYMVIERFKSDCFDAIYQRLEQQGRMLPDGLYYLNSWVNRDKNVCFQLMETTDASLFEAWTRQWRDLVEFEIFPID